ncbi:type II toxin-antitoxin system RelE/ParE family toxin [Synechococcus sp. CS-1325]|uniref:type II toxin-antitoxin system RelE/ParE family toxin n=1 Tax=unclassified Synechococcus TaxID=2626047 RepID=UPI000DB0F70F|nr:type II toxin-antitoxin system RelE/ParE family toxin [Synechococcus sp. CS-1325]MCT0231232.1 type II toxin-antitoxin system RelE/ParE family toxin [Synechococcus sp. CS-1324]PZV00470.1 MAG: type II toxin-antitoxin system RelE/ParE family toxin [Cyanobium sp.]PZV03132.1 MAG: type II toxin-antitoxin system RelE/ParE family toxin [Cyanobium sp.]
MRRALFVAPARRELLAEVAYYNNKELGLGSRFLSAVEDATARALAYPLTGTLASENTRRMFLKDFPFSLVYRPDDNGIVVFALPHHARRPEYWRERIDDR